PRMAAAINAGRAATMSHEFRTRFLERFPPDLRTMIIDPSKAPLWGMIAIRRYIAIGRDEPGGSDVDAGVEFHSLGDIIRYLPRAAEIGFLAPFPRFWFVRGENVGLAGRLLSGVETLMLYAVEVLALVGLWQRRRHLTVWLLALIAAIGVIGL